jgi:hypothetical protein
MPCPCCQYTTTWAQHGLCCTLIKIGGVFLIQLPKKGILSMKVELRGVWQRFSRTTNGRALGHAETNRNTRINRSGKPIILQKDMRSVECQNRNQSGEPGQPSTRKAARPWQTSIERILVKRWPFKRQIVGRSPGHSSQPFGQENCTDARLRHSQSRCKIIAL